MAQENVIGYGNYMLAKQELTTKVDELLTRFGTVGDKPIKGLIHACAAERVIEHRCFSHTEVSWASASFVTPEEARRFGEAILATTELLEQWELRGCEIVDGQMQPA